MVKIKFFEQMSFRLRGRNVPVIRLDDITENGQVKTLQLVGECKDRPNSIINTWDEKGWEKQSDAEMLTVIDDKGIRNMAWIVNAKGVTCNLFTKAWVGPKCEDIIGRNSTFDDIADAMALGKSMRNMFIGLVIGVLVGWLFVGPLVSTVLK